MVRKTFPFLVLTAFLVSLLVVPMLSCSKKAEAAKDPATALNNFAKAVKGKEKADDAINACIETGVKLDKVMAKKVDDAKVTTAPPAPKADDTTATGKIEITNADGKKVYDVTLKKVKDGWKISAIAEQPATTPATTPETTPATTPETTPETTPP